MVVIIKKFIGVLDKIDAILSTLLIILIFLDVMLQVFVRVTPNSISVQWTVEMGSMLLCALIWVGLGMGIKNDSHTRFSLIIDRLPGKTRRVFLILADFAFIAFNVILAYYTFTMLKFYADHGNVTQILKWGRQYTMAPMAVGLAFAAVRLLYNIINSIQHFKDPITPQSAEDIAEMADLESLKEEKNEEVKA